MQTNRSPRSRSTPRNTGNSAARRVVSDQMFETLEKRCLLSVSMDSAVDAGLGDVTPVTVNYNGVMKFKKVGDEPKMPKRDVTIVVTSTPAGELSGMITGDSMSDIDFTGQLEAGKHFSLDFEGDTEGVITGKLPKNGRVMKGVMLNITDGYRSKLKLKATDGNARSIGAISAQSTVQPTALATQNGVLMAPPDNFLSDEGELRFRGSYTGTTTLKFTTEVKQHYGNISAWSAPQVYNVTLDINEENAADQLSGTMVISGLGTYSVQGVVKWDEMTLIVQPVTADSITGPTSGVGVAKLKISRDGFNYGGEYRQESNGNDIWGFGSMNLVRRSSDVDSSVSGPVTPIADPPPQQPEQAISPNGNNYPTQEMLSPQGELRFGGSYTGTTTLRFTPEVKQHYAPVGAWSAPQVYSVDLDITSETGTDLLRGSMTISGMGTYKFLGAVKFNEMTLLVAPTTPPVDGQDAGTGVIKLKISRNGFNYNGEFRQEAAGTWGFGSMNLVRQTAHSAIDTGSGTTSPTVPPTVPAPTVPPVVVPVSPVSPPVVIVVPGTTVPPTVPTVPPVTTVPPTVPPITPPVPDPTDPSVTDPPTAPLPPNTGPVGNTPGVDIADDPDTSGGAGAPGVDNTFPGAPVDQTGVVDPNNPVVIGTSPITDGGTIDDTTAGSIVDDTAMVTT